MLDNIKKSLDKLTGGSKSTRQKYEDQMAKRQKKIDAMMKSEADRLKMQGECAAVLDECRLSFKRTINTERARADQMRQQGYETTSEEARIRECAIGILVVEEAKYKLDSIASESSMNMAMNRLGMALRQVRRLDNSATAISPSTERIMNDWCPGILEEAADMSVTQLEIPDAMRQRIDAAFVADLMNGDDYIVCMKKAQWRAKAPVAAPQEKQATAQPEGPTNEELVNEILKKAREANGSTESADLTDISSLKNQI